MFAESRLSVTREDLRTAPVAGLVETIGAWLARDNPTCLMHPHGFFVVLLARNETEEWRLHFWPRRFRPITGMPAFIHTHDCHVESRILLGQLTNVGYDLIEVSSNGQPLYEVSYGGDRYSPAASNCLRRTGSRVRVAANRNQTLTTGDSYFIERHTYHEAKVPETIATATLVCMYGCCPGAVMVVGLDGYPETITFHRTEHRASAFVGQFL